MAVVVERIGLALLLAVVIAGTVLTGISVSLRSNLLDFNSTISAEEISALWTFVAALAAVAATIITAIVARSYNRRTVAISKEAEDRQRHEAAAAFLGLLTTESGKPAGPAQLGGVVIALMGLGHTETALGVAESAVHHEVLDGPIAARVINNILVEGDSQQQELAAALLRSATRTFTSPDRQPFDWPDSLYGSWPNGLSTNARLHVMVALTEMLGSQDRVWWMNKTSWAFKMLEEALLEDHDQFLRNDALGVLEVLLSSKDDEMPFTLGDWKREVRELEESIDRHRKRNREWNRRHTDVINATDALRKRWEQ